MGRIRKYQHVEMDESRVKTVPWERLTGEPAVAYTYFCFYRDLGPFRSIDQVRRHFSRSQQLMERYSSKNYWVSRANAYEEWRDRIKLQHQEHVAKEMAERHLRLALLIQEKVIMRLKTMPIEKLSARELANLVDIATKMERTALGEPSEIMQHNNTHMQEVQNIYNDIKVINADPDAINRAFSRWEALTGEVGHGALESGVDGAHPESE